MSLLAPTLFVELTSIDGPKCYVAPQHIIAIDQNQLQLETPIVMDGQEVSSVLGTAIFLGEASGRIFVREEPKVVLAKIDAQYDKYNQQMLEYQAKLKVQAEEAQKAAQAEARNRVVPVRGKIIGG